MIKKKGKFRLLSYLVDHNLIYYRSINKEKRILAFAIFELSGYYQVDKILQNFVKRGLILFYSIEVNFMNFDKILYIFCIEHDNKSELFKRFNLLSHKLYQIDHEIHFFKNDKLENEFLKILFLNNNKNSLISDAIGSIKVKNESSIKILDFYLINYDKFPELAETMHQFINYMRNLKRYGYIIFNFQLINTDISIEGYVIDYIDDLNSNLPNLETVVNEFIGIELISKIKLELKKIFYPLWRYKLSNKYYSVQNPSKIYDFEYYYNYKHLLKFNQEFKELLDANSLRFHQFSQNLFFVEQSTLVIILANKRFNFLFKIIKSFRSKYSLLLIILNDKEYDELMKIEKINTILNLKIINYEEFYRFDLKSLSLK